jgi:hypothetical protein
LALFGPRSIGIVRIADALGNRPDVNIAETNVPAFLSVVCGSAAGEFGHGAFTQRIKVLLSTFRLPTGKWTSVLTQ